MASLVPCPRCSRHVRANETICPFCETTIESRPGRVLDAMPADRLLARTALTFAAAAASGLVGLAGLAGCGKETADKPPEPPPNVAPAYGVPVVMDDAGTVTPTPAPSPTTSTTSSATPSAQPLQPPPPQPVPAYGAPPIDRTPKKK